MKPFDIRTVTSSMYSAADDDRTSNSMPSFPTNGMDINSNTVNGYRINSNSIFDIQSVFRTSQGEIVNVAVQRNAVSSGERKGKVVRKKKKKRKRTGKKKKKKRKRQQSKKRRRIIKTRQAAKKTKQVNTIHLFFHPIPLLNHPIQPSNQRRNHAVTTFKRCLSTLHFLFNQSSRAHDTLHAIH